MEPLTPRTPDGGDSGTDAELGTMHSGSMSRGSSMTDMQCVPLCLCLCLCLCLTDRIAKM